MGGQKRQKETIEELLEGGWDYPDRDAQRKDFA
jgi:hypothetical protein